MRLRDATTRVGAGSVVLAAGCAEFHFAFGILLCAFVTWGFALHSRDPRAANESELRELARRMPRAIYLMLYSALLWGIVALCLMRALLFRRNIPQPLPMLEARS